MRTFLIPKIGVGTKEDPHRPAYVQKAGLNWTGDDDGEFYIVEVEATDKEVEDLAAQPGVVDLKDETRVIDAEVKVRADVFSARRVDAARKKEGWSGYLLGNGVTLQ